jgi:hypothetical protein
LATILSGSRYDALASSSVMYPSSTIRLSTYHCSSSCTR